MRAKEVGKQRRRRRRELEKPKNEARREEKTRRSRRGRKGLYLQVRGDLGEGERSGKKCEAAPNHLETWLETGGIPLKRNLENWLIALGSACSRGGLHPGRQCHS